MDWNSRKNSTYVVVAVGVVFLIILIIQISALKDPSGYIEKIEQERQLKNTQFRSTPQSPLSPEQKSSFKGLNYFPIDPMYQIPAEITLEDTRDTLLLTTSEGNDYRTVRIGSLRFKLQRTQQELIAYQYVEGENKNMLFVPFYDLTSNVSTYGGGRYLDIPYGANIIIDFNKAYNPYCVYNEDYECPFPPRKNNLPLEIFAGEKVYP